MKRALLLAVSAVFLLGASSGPGAVGAAGVPFKATGSGTNVLATCPAGFTLCFKTSGSFSEPRLGAGTFTALTKQQTTGACTGGSGIAGTAAATLTATVPGGTLKLLLDATFCAAADLTAALDGTFTVTGGTGRLAGASGSGSFTGKASLASEQLTLTGTLFGVTDELSGKRERLTVSRDPRGSVRSSPAGIACPGACTAEFRHGTKVTLTAHPATGASFSSWNKGAVCPELTNAVCALTMSGSRFVHAFFAAKPAASHGTRVLRVSLQGPGRVTSSPAGISCPGKCEAKFPRGAKVVLSTTPASNAAFSRWFGDAACVANKTKPSCALTLWGDRRAVAWFSSTR